MKGQKITRLAKEYQQLKENPPAGVVIISEEPFTLWDVYIDGPQATPYEGGKFKFRFDFPDTYPFQPPKVKILTKIYHPLVYNNEGEFSQYFHCVFNQNWVPSKFVKYIIETIISMFISPMDYIPYGSEIATVLKNDKVTFDKNATDYTLKYAQ